MLPLCTPPQLPISLPCTYCSPSGPQLYQFQLAISDSVCGLPPPPPATRRSLLAGVAAGGLDHKPTRPSEASAAELPPARRLLLRRGAPASRGWRRRLVGVFDNYLGWTAAGAKPPGSLASGEQQGAAPAPSPPPPALRVPGVPRARPRPPADAVPMPPAATTPGPAPVRVAAAPAPAAALAAGQAAADATAAVAWAPVVAASVPLPGAAVATTAVAPLPKDSASAETQPEPVAIDDAEPPAMASWTPVVSRYRTVAPPAATNGTGAAGATNGTSEAGAWPLAEEFKAPPVDAGGCKKQANNGNYRGIVQRLALQLCSVPCTAALFHCRPALAATVAVPRGPS
jgi:hypothetical protein